MQQHGKLIYKMIMPHILEAQRVSSLSSLNHPPLPLSLRAGVGGRQVASLSLPLCPHKYKGAGVSRVPGTDGTPSCWDLLQMFEVI